MNTTMRLAIVRQKYRSDGGAERFILRALKALNNSEIELNIITRRWSNKIQSNWHIHICNPQYNSRTERERGFASTAERYWKQHNFDLVQSHERIVGCDIFRAGDGVHRAWLEQRARIIPAYKRWMTKISCYHHYVLSAERNMFYSKKLKKIICNSKMVQDDILRYYNVEKNKITLIYNSIDSQKFMPANDRQRHVIRKVLSIPEQACVLIFVGSGFERKGLQQAISAIDATDRYLIIVGQDKKQFRYQSFAQSLGCLSRTRFMGICHNVLPYYHASDALILPTLYDPFPNVILEAMSCGLPVITSPYCGGAEFIEQGKTGFICDNLDIFRLRTFIAETPSRNEDLNMSIAARQRVITCTPLKLARQLTDLYQKLLL